MSVEINDNGEDITTTMSGIERRNSSFRGNLEWEICKAVTDVLVKENRDRDTRIVKITIDVQMPPREESNGKSREKVSLS